MQNTEELAQLTHRAARVLAPPDRVPPSTKDENMVLDALHNAANAWEMACQSALEGKCLASGRRISRAMRNFAIDRRRELVRMSKV